MLRARIGFFTLAAVVLAFFGVFGARGHGQTNRSPVVEFFAPPPIDRGLVPSVERAPDTVETAIRAAIRRSAVALDRAGASGAHYIAGKVIVKFKDGASATSRASVMSAAKANRSTQPSYANFDVMSIDANADAEEVARTLAGRPDVEYAQAAYRAHADCASGWAAADSNGRCVPNDEFFPRQWNLSDIDMERAWDIQPGATPSVIVAVLDSGMAFQDAIVQYNARAFRVVFSNGSSLAYPALGPLQVPFAAAPDLRGAGARWSEGQLRLRIVDSSRINPASIMPAYHRTEGLVRVAPAWRDKPVLTAEQIEDVVAFLMTLRD